MYIKLVLCTTYNFKGTQWGERSLEMNEAIRKQAYLGLLCFLYPIFLSETFYKMLIWTE